MENNAVVNSANKVGIDLDSLVEIKLGSDDNFLKVKETLTRIGVASNSKKEIYQSCHILQKRGKYYITHFKELFGLDGKSYSFSEEDKARRNTIANLLAEWGLITLVDANKTKDPVCPLAKIKVLKFSEKNDWTLKEKYQMSSSRRKDQQRQIETIN